MRVLVAGGSGVLGRAAIPLLVLAGHDVTATTRSVAKAGLLRALGARAVVVDALEPASLTAAMSEAEPDAVLHLMTDLGSGSSASNAHLRRVGTRNLVDAALRHGVRRMVAESISWIYEPGEVEADEDAALDLEAAEPRRTTVGAVAALEAAVREMPDSVVLRFGQLYGPGTWYSRDGDRGRRARAGELAVPEAVTSFVHVADAARAAVDALRWRPGTRNVVDDEPARGAEWGPVFAAAVGAAAPAVERTGDIGRPVSNRRARLDGLGLDLPTWRTGFASL